MRVDALTGVVDIETLSVDAATELATNEIGLATLQTADPLVVDDYRDNRVTGSFVLIDEVTNATVAAGMVGRASFLSSGSLTVATNPRYATTTALARPTGRRPRLAVGQGRGTPASARGTTRPPRSPLGRRRAQPHEQAGHQEPGEDVERCSS